MGKLSIGLGILAVGLLSACEVFFPGNVRGAGSVIVEQRRVRGVHGVDLALPGELSVVIDEDEGLTIEAQENLLPYIESSLQEGILLLQSPPSVFIQPSQPARYTLAAARLDTLRISANGNISASQLEGEDCEITIRGGGNVHIAELNCQRLQVEILSSGSITIVEGVAEVQRLSLSGSGAYEASGLQSATAQVELSGSGDAALWVSERLEVNLSGAGNVVYYGQPALQQQITGAGKVIPRGEK